jgi:uncharacterized membrane protein YdbT with pleckstrin-like domain
MEQSEHFDSRPAWRYQWSAVAGFLAMSVVVVWSAVYGPAHIGVGIADIVLSVAVALSLYFVLLMIYRRFAWRYLIDDQNIESYHGVLARRVHSIRIQDLRNVNVNQTVMQRLFSVGDVEFSSAAAGDAEVIFFGVPDPLQVKELAQRLQAHGAAPAL